MSLKDNKKMMGYSVEDLLIGHEYYSPNSYKSGEIISAEKLDNIWVGSNATAYLIGYRDDSNIKTQYATIAVTDRN